MHHGPMVHDSTSSSSNQASSQASVPTSTSNTKSEAPKAEGFNMLIAAATSESMNSIDEEEKVTQQVTVAAKGILKHPRGKQLVSPLAGGEEKTEKEAAAVEQRDDKEKEETQSAGPLKKRRKMEEHGVTVDDVFVFLEKLHKLLTDASLDESSQAMEWLTHGKGFRVLRWDVLVEKVLPELMNGKEEMGVDALIQSFKGQLKDCGFVDVKRGKDYGSYCHKVCSSCA
jgi:hypothetical protein